MKKLVIVFFLVLLVLSLSLVSASWFGDFWGKITGKQTLVDKCTDSDGGKDIFVKGTTCLFSCVSDVCSGSSIVVERYCCGELCSSTESITCPSGYICSDGACVIRCGNGVVDSGEQCDSNSGSCTDPNGYSGTKNCRSDCTWNSCTITQSCGDGVVNGNEQCDSNSQTCTNNGYSGTKNCRSDCTWNTCIPIVPTEFCGNRICNSANETASNCPEDCGVNANQTTTTPTEETTIPSEQKPEPRPPEPEIVVPEVPPTEEVRVCATKIRVTSDKTTYYYGDDFKLEVGIFDSQGNPVPNYPVYSTIYTYADNIWHTPKEDKTSENGYIMQKGKIEKGEQAVGKTKVKAYTKAYTNCNSVEDILEVEIREGKKREEVCGIGTCVPEEVKGVEVIPENNTFYFCSGCKMEGKCYPMGYRRKGTYCSDNYEFVNQIEEGMCDNSFECKSNVCVSDECVGEGLIKKIFNWFKKLFGAEEEEEKPKPEVDCSKLLIEKNIGDYEYNQSAYGNVPDAQAPVYSEDGEQIGVVKCCVAQYIDKSGNGVAAAMVCPFDNREDIKNSLKSLSARGELVSEEYKGQKIYRVAGKEVMIWINNAHILAVGTGPGIDISPPEDIPNAYLEKYPDDLEDIEIPEAEVPYEPRAWVTCSEEDEKAVKECLSHPGSKLQTDPHPDKDCEVYVGCILSDEPKGYRDTAKEFLVEAEQLGELTLIDFETIPPWTILQNGDKLDGYEWRSLEIIFEFPSEDYLQVFGPKYPFNPLDKLSLSPGLGPFEAGGDTHDDLNIIFTKPVKAAGIYLLDLGDTDDRESITFLDRDNNIIKKISPWPKSTFGNPAPGTFVGLIHEAGISKIEIKENPRDSDDIAYDNLYFVR